MPVKGLEGLGLRVKTIEFRVYRVCGSKIAGLRDLGLRF